MRRHERNQGRPGSDVAPEVADPPQPPARVLVVGVRRGLCDALRRRHIDFAVWNDPARRVNRAQFVHAAPLYESRARARDEAERILERHGPFTHVVAGSESGVLAAAVARRVLGARQSSHTTVMRCRDKLLMKRHLSERGIPMTPFVEVVPDAAAREVLDALGGKVVVKGRTASGGRGIVVVEDEASFEQARRRGLIAERYVDAPEVSVESFVNHHRILFQNVTEYVRKGSVNLVPGGLPRETHEAVLALNRKVIEALRIDWGITHVELYLTPDGTLFGEIALRPPGGYIMDLLELAWRLPAWDAFVAVELDLPVAFPTEAWRVALACVLHPGAGRVARIVGESALRADPRVVEAKLKIAPGDAVPERIGVGIDVGHVLLIGGDREEALDALRFVDDTLRIELEPASG